MKHPAGCFHYAGLCHEGVSHTSPDVWIQNWKEKLSGTGLYVHGIHAFYAIDTHAKPTGSMISGAAWGEDIPENITPPIKEFFNVSPAEY